MSKIDHAYPVPPGDDWEGLRRDGATVRAQDCDAGH